MLPVQTALLILLLPLASAVVIALFLRKQGALASYISTGAAGVLAVLSLQLIFGGKHDINQSWEWLRFGDFAISLGFKFDDLAALMLFVVSFVGFLIHVFSPKAREYYALERLWRNAKTLEFEPSESE